MRLLLIYNESNLLKEFHPHLQKNFIVDSAFTYDDCLFLANTQNYQLLLMDMESNYGSLQAGGLIKSLRREKLDSPILGLANGSLRYTAVDVLNCGADDYLQAPFAWRELQAHICALLRRGMGSVENYKQVGRFRLELKSKNIFFKQRVLILGRKQHLILECLLVNHPHIVSKQTLAAFAWETDWVDRNTIDAHLSQLRKDLFRQISFDPIQTRRGLGYRLIACELRPKTRDLALWGGREKDGWQR